MIKNQMTLEELRDYNSLETQSLQKLFIKKYGKSFQRYNNKEIKSYVIVPQYPKKLMSLFLKFNINLK